MGNQRTNLGCKQPLTARGLGEIERLDAHPISNQVQHRLPRIPGVVNADGEHAVEALDAVDAPLFVSVQQHFGIGMVRPPRVLTESLELAAHVGVVVDLAVVSERNRSCRVHHRLSGRVGQVDDRQPAMTERGALVGRRPHADAIRAAVRHPIAHPFDQIEHRLAARGTKATDNSTHANPSIGDRPGAATPASIVRQASGQAPVERRRSVR